MPTQRFFVKDDTLIDELVCPGKPITSACTQHGGAVTLCQYSIYNTKVLAARVTPWPCRKHLVLRKLITELCFEVGILTEVGEFVQPKADVPPHVLSLNWGDSIWVHKPVGDPLVAAQNELLLPPVCSRVARYCNPDAACRTAAGGHWTPLRRGC
jgi:hypothetical protein